MRPKPVDKGITPRALPAAASQNSPTSGCSRGGKCTDRDTTAANGRYVVLSSTFQRRAVLANLRLSQPSYLLAGFLAWRALACTTSGFEGLVISCQQHSPRRAGRATSCTVLQAMPFCNSLSSGGKGSVKIDPQAQA